MKFFTKKINGSISLFLSMIILLLVIMEGYLIDGSKVLAAKMMMASAGDMTLNAGLTYYDEALRDIYGLFAISESEAELKQNLKLHFQKTIGEAAGEADEGYVDQLMGYIEESISGGWSGEEAGKLINLQLDDTFAVSGAEDSVLSKPYVMKQQILEYMKYRGPVSIGYGMLEKIYAFKDLKKQQQVMEKKLDYEEKMSDIQKACEDAYGNIWPYNDLLEDGMKPTTVKSRAEKANENMKKAIQAVWCYSALSRDYLYDVNWRRKIPSETRIDVRAALNNCTLLDSLCVRSEQAEDELSSAFDEHIPGSMDAIKVILGYVKEYEKFRSFYTVWENYKKYYEEEKENLEDQLENLDSEEDKDEIESLEEELEELEVEYEENEELYDTASDGIDSLINVFLSAKEILSSDVETYMGNAKAEIDQIGADADHLERLAKGGIKALDEVIRQMEELKARGEQWQGTIGDLSAGDLKTSMQTDYDNKAKELDKEKINALKNRLVKGEAYANAVLNAVKATKAINLNLYESALTSYADRLKYNLETVYEADTKANEVGYESFDVGYWTECAKDNNGLKEPDTVWMDTVSWQSYEISIPDITAKDDEFFKYLERVCPKNEMENEDKDSAEEDKKNLLNKGKSVGTETEDESRIGNLPSDVTGAFGENKSSFTETGTDADDKTVSKNAKENTKSAVDFMDVGALLESGRDKLYITEYCMEMFSYYTVDRTREGELITSDWKETLSGMPITAENNLMYKAEAEYILWGNENGNEDVQYTLATIFGIRMLLNSIYAFTSDPEIKSTSLMLATAIAGWTGFGVPLVQSVIILAFALAETAVDMSELKEGKSVPIYKGKENWVVKPSGISKTAVNEALKAANAAAKDYIADKLDSLTEETKEEFRKSLDDLKKASVENIMNVASAAILNPLQERVLSLVNVVSPSEEKIAGEVDNALQNLEETIESEPEGIVKQAKKKALEIFKTQLKKGLNDMLAKVQQKVTGEQLTIAQINSEVERFFGECKNELRTKLNGFVNPLVEEAASGVETALDSGADLIKEETSKAMDTMLVRLSLGVSDSGLPLEAPAGAQGQTAGAAALTMNYKEYLGIFLAVASIGNEEVILKRIGNLVQANIAVENKSKSFNITKAYTMLEVKASADLKTTFFAVPLPVSGGGTSVGGQDTYKIAYHGILGY